MIGLVRIIDCVGIIVLLTLPFLIQESPFWLIANGKNHEAREVLNKIALFNGSDYRVPEEVTLVLDNT